MTYDKLVRNACIRLFCKIGIVLAVIMLIISVSTAFGTNNAPLYYHALRLMSIVTSIVLIIKLKNKHKFYSKKIYQYKVYRSWRLWNFHHYRRCI